jgi:O-antigen/teichoic acid export membrane protein
MHGPMDQPNPELAPRSLGRSAAIAFAANVVALCLAVAVAVVVSRSSGAAGRGQYEIMIVVALISARLAGLGLGPAAIGLLGQPGVPAGAAARAAVATSIGVGALCWLLVPAVAASSISAANRTVAVLGLMSVLPVAVTLQWSVVMRGLGRDRAHAHNVVLRSVVLLLGALVVERASLGAPGFAAAWLASWTVAAFHAWSTLRTPLRTGGPVRPHLRELVRYGVRFEAGTLIGMATRCDVVLLGATAGTRQAGLYAGALGAAQVLLQFATAAQLALLPRLRRHAGTASERGAAASRAVIAATVLGACVVLVAGPATLVLALGPEFSAARWPLVVLTLAVVPWAVATVAQTCVQGSGAPGAVVPIVATSLATQLCLSAALSPTWGALGAAVANLAAALIAATWSLRRVTSPDQRIVDWLVPTSQDLARARSWVHAGAERAHRAAARAVPGTARRDLAPTDR